MRAILRRASAVLTRMCSILVSTFRLLSSVFVSARDTGPWRQRVYRSRECCSIDIGSDLFEGEIDINPMTRRLQ
jgi:hypothetical protein